MARKLRRRFGVSMYNALRLARTEMARVQAEAKIHPHCFCSIAVATEEQVQAKDWYNKNSGGISGAITDMYSDEASNAAEKDYGRIRKMRTDVSKISRNTGLSAETVQDVKDFVFLDQHNLGGKHERFAPDFAMSQSWIRLVNGNFE